LEHIVKIESIIKRPGGTHVPFDQTRRWPAARYHFKPQEGAGEDAPHVADVPNEAHIARLLSITEGFRPFLANSANVPMKRPTELSAGAAGSSSESEPPTQTFVVTSDAGGEGESEETDQEQTGEQGGGPLDAQIAAIRELTIKELKGQINSFSDEALAAARDAETARTDDAPRKGFIDVINAHLGVGDGE
jgi:hypothetical protein